jgi:uncharacterized protein YndB with AHSA1/START domain
MVSAQIDGGTALVSEQIEGEVVIAAPVEKVWSILTEAEHLRTWFGNAGAEIDLRPGGDISLAFEGHGRFLGHVEVVKPPRQFTYRWAQMPDVRPSAGNSTLVEFTLTPEGTSTRLRVVESGFRGLDLPEEQKTSLVKEHTEGWKEIMDGFVAYAESQAT